MRALVAWAAHNRLLALLFSAAFVVAGLVALSKLPIDAVPDVTNVQVQVVTRAPSLSASEVETQITQPVERAMSGTPGLRTTRSVTRLGISVVTLIFDDASDVYFARTMVNERLGAVRDQIPAEIGRPELGPISTALGEIFMFELVSSRADRSPEELRAVVEWQVAPRLRQVPGVIEVVGYGGSVKQFRVTIDPTRLTALGISAAEVRAALERDNRVSGGGFIERGGEQIILRADARFHGIEDIAATVVRTDASGAAIRVGQIAEVDTGPAPRQGAMSRDGRGEVVGGSVLMLKGGNSRQVVADVKRAIADLAPELPAGVALEAYYDRSDFIDRVLATIAKNLTEGALIVVGCLLLTLGSLRAGLLVAGAIPFSMLVGFIGLYLLGYSGNVMSLGAVDFGIIVEGAVVTIEHAVTHAGTVEGRARRREAIVHAMQEVAKPALFTVIITILVFLPLVALEDVEGKMFRPVVYSLCFMLLGAIVYSLFLLPAVAPFVLRDVSAKEPAFARAARRLYAPLLARALRRPKWTLALATGVTIAMLSTGAKLGADFLPRIFEGALAIDVLRPPSTSLESALEFSKVTEDAARESPEVVSVVSRIGRPEGAVDPVGPESSDVFVTLKPRSEWREGMTPEALVSELSQRINARVPATVNAFSQPIEMRINDLVAGVKSDVAIKLFGEDLATMNAFAEKIRRSIASVDGATDVKIELAFGQPAVNVTVDRDRVAHLGVPPSDVLDAVQMVRSGLSVGQIREGERVFDLTLRLASDDVKTPADLLRLPISTRSATVVPLAMVADVVETEGLVQVAREQLHRRLIVQANVRGRDVVGFVEEAQARVRSLEIPHGVRMEWGGQFQNFNRAKTRLTMLVPLALGAIALMLVVMFKRTGLVLATLLNLPFAVGGGVLALVVRGLPFSIPAGVGFIALCGVSVTTGIVMTTQLLATAPDGDPVSRVTRAALASFRAPLSTALVAAIGFIPAAIATGTGAEVQRPLASVVIGGLCASMLLSLFALPAMLLQVAKRDEPEVRPVPLPSGAEPEPGASPRLEAT